MSEIRQVPHQPETAEIHDCKSSVRISLMSMVVGVIPDHVGIVRIILMYNLLQSGTALKRIVALL